MKATNTHKAMRSVFRICERIIRDGMASSDLVMILKNTHSDFRRECARKRGRPLTRHYITTHDCWAWVRECPTEAELAIWLYVRELSNCRIANSHKNMVVGAFLWLMKPRYPFLNYVWSESSNQDACDFDELLVVNGKSSQYWSWTPNSHTANFTL
ncbi:hypothetical protein [Enterovibrio nigricans]|uniref:Uncharacterized protein n=1 Tax=Enterovibrio nigricans DSM 22720 TaxID=1121868 RepID=A0A1T4V738_9GAMM|nr:hypothetical protein [Enterovibrio nigricans]PKF49393.1 hypothetical protein AT251_19180 [Enterovibrio nigricans]SKA60361.1 hypothetical protein SAMN02745132_03292 [Enterovibrio nigricans DSM 22720]